MRKFDNVLLVDDDILLSTPNAKLIESSKIATKVDAATNPKQALKTLKKIATTGLPQFPRIIFLAIDMPEMNAWQFLSELEKLPQNVLTKCRVILLSSSIDLFQIKKAKSNGMVNDYITKPLNMKSCKCSGR